MHIPMKSKYAFSLESNLISKIIFMLGWSEISAKGG